MWAAHGAVPSTPDLRLHPTLHPFLAMPPSQTPDPPIEIHIHPTTGDSLTPVLHGFLPYSLALLRRIQFRHRSPHRTLLASFAPSASPIPTTQRATSERQRQNSTVEQHAQTARPFVVAFVDRRRAPETECWILTSFELSAARAAEGHGRLKSRDGDEPQRVDGDGNVRGGGAVTHEGEVMMEEEDAKVTKAYLGALFDAISHLPCPANVTPEERRILRVGALHSSLVPVLASAGWLERCSVPWQKWIFPSTSAPQPSSSGREHVMDPVGEESELPPGFWFDRVPAEGLELVRQRSEVPRTVSGLGRLVGVGVFTAPTRTDDCPDVEGASQWKMVAWGFLGVDGSVSALHVESPWRGLGLAKAVMRRLLERRDYGASFEGDEDGYAGHADVHGTNRASLAVCARLGAWYGWNVHWVRVSLGRVDESMEGLLRSC